MHELETNQKYYNVEIGYPNFRRALQSMGWKECKDPERDHLLDCKFAFGCGDIDYNKMKPGCWIN